MPKSALFNPVPAAVVVGLTLVIWFAVPAPAGVTPNAWHLFALFIGTIAAIIGKAMPIGSLSVIAIAITDSAPIGIALPMIAAMVPMNSANRCQALGDTLSGTGATNQIRSARPIAMALGTGFGKLSFDSTLSRFGRKPGS